MNKSRRVLVISANYWPETAGNAPYVTGMAEHLAAQGHKVVVATGFPHYPSWTSTSRGRLWKSEVRNGVRIRRRWHYVPRRQSALRRGLYEATLTLSGMTAIWPRRFDVVIGVSPSLSGAAVAAGAATMFRCPYGLIIQDLVSRAASQSGVSGGGKVAGLLEKFELKLARSATGVGVIADGFRDYLVAMGVQPSRIQRLRNWSNWHEPSEERTAARDRLGWQPDEFVCLHAGNMGHKQGLENLLDTAELLRGTRVRIVLAGDGNRRQDLEVLAAERGLSNVLFLPPQVPGEYEAMLMAADLLLVNQRPAVGDMALASKLTSYFAAGVAVVAAVARDSETGKELVAAGAGEVVRPDVPNQLSEAIVRLMADAPLRESYGGAGRKYVAARLRSDVVLHDIERFVVSVAARVPVLDANQSADFITDISSQGAQP